MKDGRKGRKEARRRATRPLDGKLVTYDTKSGKHGRVFRRHACSQDEFQMPVDITDVMGTVSNGKD